jgi:hypothetical protein
MLDFHQISFTYLMKVIPMNISKASSTLGLVALGLITLSTGASAATFQSLPTFTDSSFQQLVNNGTFTRTFTAVSRLGNNAIGSTAELNITNASGKPIGQSQRVWNNGQAYRFSLEYTGTQLIYKVAENTITTNFSDKITDIYLRTRSQNNSGVSLNSLSLNDVNGPSLFSQAGANLIDTDYLRISDISAPFILTGQQKFNWQDTGSVSSSRLTYQIRAGVTAPSIPTPALLPGLMGLGLATWRRREIKSSSGE